MKPKHKPPDGEPGSGSGVIRFSDLPAVIQRRATRIRSRHPMLTLQQAVIAALEHQARRKGVNETQRIQEQYRETLIAIEAHGYVFVGEPRVRGGATLLDFHRFSDNDEAQVAEGELLFWLAELDAAKVARERIANTVKPRRKRAVPARQERMALDEPGDTMDDFRRIQDEIRAAMGDE